MRSASVLPLCPLVLVLTGCNGAMSALLCFQHIEVRGSATGAILGWGESVQSSLAAMGKTFSDVIDRALAGLFGDPAPWVRS